MSTLYDTGDEPVNPTTLATIKDLHARSTSRQRLSWDTRQIKWQAYKALGEKYRLMLPFATRVDYAYSPRENVGSLGKDHIVTLEDIQIGRIKRKAGDALCKPRAKFWGLTDLENGSPATCLKCLEVAERLVLADQQKAEDE